MKIYVFRMLKYEEFEVIESDLYIYICWYLFNNYNNRICFCYMVVFNKYVLKIMKLKKIVIKFLD